jgi:protein phosphatase
MTSAHASHPGLVRQNNEDCLRTDDNLGIYLLADGIGGHNAGEIASALAVEVVYTALRSKIENCSSDDLFELMADALLDAHDEITAKARTSLSFMGMGTTLVVAVVREGMVYIAHVGDSRGYHFHTQPHPLPNPPLEREGIKKSPFRKGDLGGFAVDLTNQIPPGPPFTKWGNCLKTLPHYQRSHHGRSTAG